MKGLSLNSNAASSTVQRRLADASSRRQLVFERLSSGLRINRASDDAAGLAVSEKLNIDSRVYGQAVRNVNDGISMLSIAEGGVQQLSSILIRIQELAEQASNGVYTDNQRAKLNLEAQALSAEYKRIVKITS